jgi:hypothetical protein
VKKTRKACQELAILPLSKARTNKFLFSDNERILYISLYPENN